MSAASPRVHTVVLNFRAVDDTLRCLESLRGSTYRNQTLTVVDNGATPETRDALAAALPSTHVITSEENLGYAGGNNLGIRYALEAGADMVWLLNPDTEVDATALERMVATAVANPTAGIVGCRILNGHGRGDTIWADGADILWDEGGATRHRRAGAPDRDAPAGAPFTTDYVSGASMLVRRDVFGQVGLLPEEYFLYFEETDFNVRAHRRGWRLLVDPTARVVHYQRSYERVPTPRYVYYYVRNRIVFGRRFSELSPEELEASARRWADGWRSRIAERAPAWLDTFDHLVDTAVADAHQDRTGRRADIEDVPHAEAAA